MRKGWQIALVVFALAAVLAGAAGPGPQESVLRVGWPYEPASMDPHRANEDAAYNALRMMVECLVRNVNGEAVPGVAESWDVSPDNKEYTFHLRKSRFSDGSPVTARDFQYSLFRLLDGSRAFAKANSAFVIKNAEAYFKGKSRAEDVGIEVKNDHTLKLTLAVPTFPLVFSDWPFSPMNRSFVESKGAVYGSEAANLLTNGPFTLKTWDHDSRLVLVKNENYWDQASISLSRIEAFINAAGDTAVDMMLAKQLDLAEFSNRNQVRALQEKGFEVESYASNYQFMHINHKGKNEKTGRFLSNTNFRKALSLAIDRQALVATAYTTSTPSTRLTAPNERGVKGKFNVEYPYAGIQTSADPGKAKEYLALALSELKLTAADIPTFTMLCFDSQSSLLALQAVQDMLKRTIGVDCTIDAQPIPSMIAKVYASDYDLWKGGSSLGKIDWLDDVAKSYLSGAGAPYNYRDAAFDALYAKAAAATTWKERKDRMFEIEKHFCANVVDLLLNWQQIYVVHKPGVDNLHLSTYLDYTFATLKR